MIANNISTGRLLFGLIKTKAFETFVLFSPIPPHPIAFKGMRDEESFSSCLLKVI